MNYMKDNENVILHVLVIGFHHKKGCQVEYSYPPLINGGSSESDECPSGWKYLPTLALPDGSHNYNDDTVYFHLPSLNSPNETVFGISCYRQIPVEKVKNRTSDLTRDTVQKAVCVLSKIPLYGHIEVKMSLITHAYFEEGDFTKVALLQDTYNHLNLCLKPLLQSNETPQYFDGLSAREFVLKFRHKALLLFKLLLLEKRVIFYCSPVKSLCASILSLLSLYPGMLQNGLYQSGCVTPSRPMSPVPDFHINEEQHEDVVIKKEATKSTAKRLPHTFNNLNVLYTNYSNSVVLDKDVTVNEIDSGDQLLLSNKCQYNNETNDKINSDYDIGEDVTIRTNFTIMNQLDLPMYDVPLQIFTDGYLCLPYLSLPYMDLLTDRNVRGYVIGATNVLFKQKKHLADVVVEVDTAKIETDDNELKRLLHLSTEDLRFADYILKHVIEDREGGDEWIRMQFKIYLLSLLRTSLLSDSSREIDHFNASFMSTWKDSNNYKVWSYSNIEHIHYFNPCHPFAGQLSVADMKLRLTHTLHSSEGGRKLNQAMVTTGKAVGGALSQARGAVSNWWTNLTNTPTNGTSPLIEESTSYIK